MSSFFDSLFKWFHKDSGKKNSSQNGDETGIILDQRKVQFNLLDNDQRPFHRKYVSCQTQTDTDRSIKKTSCEVMTDPIDFPLSSFDTEPRQKREAKESKKSKYGFKTPVQIDENFKFEFTFHNHEKTLSGQKENKANSFQFNFSDDSDDNKNSQINSTEYKNTFENNNNNNFEVKNEISNNENSETENKPDSDDKSEKDNRTGYNDKTDSENNTEGETNSENNNEEEEEEESYYESEN